MINKISLTILCLFLFVVVNAQPKPAQRLLTGVVKDHSSLIPLAYISVSLKDHFIGTTTNENGEFDFYIPDSITVDTLIVNSLGYKPVYYALDKIDKTLSIEMQSNSFELKEVTIRPLSAEDYIRLAMRYVKMNYPDKPFVSDGYFRRKVLENKQVINFDEAIVKTYYPDYQDTVKNQHQLLLYRKAEEKEIAFMKEKRESKERKKEAKIEKDKANGKTLTEEQKKEKKTIADMFGGPDKILALDVLKEEPDFLDTTKLKDFEYSFGAATTYQGNEVVVINFKSDGKVDHVRTDGKIYIDLNSYAIVNVDFSAEFVIPLMYRPVIFLAGYSISNPQFQQKVSYQEVNNHWYPQSFQFNVQVKLEREYWFKKNDVSDIFVAGLFAINKIETENLKQIAKEFRYDPKKKLEDQVHNTEGITWGELNIIKR